MGTAQTFVAQWMRHRDVLLELLDTIPEDQARFRPWDGAMSLAELAIHAASSGDWFVQAVSKGSFERPAANVTADTMEETRAIVRDYTEKTKQTMSELSDAQIEAVVNAKSIFGFDAPGKVWLHTMREHEIHHKGQLFVYARLVGVEKLPFFVSTKG